MRNANLYKVTVSDKYLENKMKSILVVAQTANIASFILTKNTNYTESSIIKVELVQKNIIVDLRMLNNFGKIYG